MTKGEIIKFLEPFDDDISIGVRADGLMAPYTYKLKYIPATEDHYASVVILQTGTVVLRT